MLRIEKFLMRKLESWSELVELERTHSRLENFNKERIRINLLITGLGIDMGNREDIREGVVNIP